MRIHPSSRPNLHGLPSPVPLSVLLPQAEAEAVMQSSALCCSLSRMSRMISSRSLSSSFTLANGISSKRSLQSRILNNSCICNCNCNSSSSHRSYSSSTSSTTSTSASSSAYKLSNRSLAITATAIFLSLVSFSQLYTSNHGHQASIACQSGSARAATEKEDQDESDLPKISHLDPSVLTDSSAPMRLRMETYIKLLQHSIVSTLSKEEPPVSSGGSKFFIDSWLRSQGGEGISCVLQNGATFDKAGVNISIVHGNLPKNAIKQMSADHSGLMERTGYRPQLQGEIQGQEIDSLPFYAAGLSLVVHPKNPFVPTVHFNYRYFELNHPKTLKNGQENPRYKEALEETRRKFEKNRKESKSNNSSSDVPSEPEPITWWFGGGTDLTPIYLNMEESKHFHQTLKNAADKHDSAFYPNWKSWCDKYFYIPHRRESRGIGGIFFDDLFIPIEKGSSSFSEFVKKYGRFIPLNDGSSNCISSSNKPHTSNSLFLTIQELGNSFLPAYLPLVQRNKNKPYGERHVKWQELRRGRYVEFNLVYDRGTKFGLMTPGARIESILMSLPLRARWEYMEKFSGGGLDPLTSMNKKAEGEGDGKEEGKEEMEIMKVLRSPREWVE